MINPKLWKLISAFRTFQYPKGQMVITSLTTYNHHYNGRMYTLIIYQELNFDHVHRRVSFWHHGSHLWDYAKRGNVDKVIAVQNNVNWDFNICYWTLPKQFLHLWNWVVRHQGINSFFSISPLLVFHECLLWFLLTVDLLHKKRHKAKLVCIFLMLLGNMLMVSPYNVGHDDVTHRDSGISMKILSGSGTGK